MGLNLGVSAYNIHSGGGKTVLLAFLRQMSEDPQISSITCYIDSRMETSDIESKKVLWVRVYPSLFSRLQAEFQYLTTSERFDIFYCLGNLPPLFRLNKKTILFLQNKLLLTTKGIFQQSPLIALRLFIEYIWLHAFIGNVSAVEVQTSSMKDAFLQYFSFDSSMVHIKNYHDNQKLIIHKKRFENDGIQKIQGSYIYVCSGARHKNIQNLLTAFSEFNRQRPKSILYLTLPENSQFIDLAKEMKVNYKATGEQSYSDILKLIYSCEYLIYPSVMESLGLPLIEAQTLGTKIIASNLDYVYDVCVPDLVFDPYQAESILNALVKT